MVSSVVHLYIFHLKWHAVKLTMQKQIFKQNDNALSVHSKQLDVY